MATSADRIPHALDTAHRRLGEAMDEGIRQYKRNLRCSNLLEISEHIERFVDALYGISGGQDELHRRATLIEKCCGTESDYVKARTRALASYKGWPRKLSAQKVAIGRLRRFATGRPPDAPRFLGQVAQVRKDIERLLNGDAIKLSDVARQAFDTWRSVCRKVQREANALEVDGCWFLFHVHQAGEDVGVGDNLELVKAAAASLVAWVREDAREKPASNTTPARKRPGPRKANYQTQEREAQFAAEWARARDNRVLKADFAADKNMSVADLDRLLDRVYARKKGSDN